MTTYDVASLVRRGRHVTVVAFPASAGAGRSAPPNGSPEPASNGLVPGLRVAADTGLPAGPQAQARTAQPVRAVTGSANRLVPVWSSGLLDAPRGRGIPWARSAGSARSGRVLDQDPGQRLRRGGVRETGSPRTDRQRPSVTAVPDRDRAAASLGYLAGAESGMGTLVNDIVLENVARRLREINR